MSADLSFADAAGTMGGRVAIRLLEAMGGRAALIRRGRGYQADLAQGGDIWQVMMRRYGLRLEVARGRLTHIPAQGPLVVVSNHPFGILDGLALGHIIAQRRQDFRILANDVFLRVPEIARWTLPISFANGPEAMRRNLATRRDALACLARGGAVGVFPGGTVSTAARMMGTPVDPGWRSFTARMIARADAAVVPVFFEGQTTRLFQIASHLHPTLRMGLLVREFARRVDGPVPVRIGAPVARGDLAAHGQSGKTLMDFLRKATYELGPEPRKHLATGREFDMSYQG